MKNTKHSPFNKALSYVAAAITLLFVTTVHAQYENLKFETYSTIEGLSSSTCLEIFQDKDGFVWFGTIDGLNKYNGYEFEIFRTEPDDPNSISNNRINAISQDKYGNLWIGTSNGLNVFNAEKEEFLRIDLHKDETQGFKSRNTINDIFYDEANNAIWVATQNGACQILLGTDFMDHIKTLPTRYYLHDPNNTESIDNKSATSILKDRNGDIWIGTEGSHLNKYNPDLDNFQRILINEKSYYKLNHLPNIFIEDKDGDFWIGNNLSNLIVWDKSKNQFKKLSLSSKNIPIFDIFIDHTGIFWIATDGYGTFLYEKDKGVIKHIEHNPNDPFSLPNNQISKTIEDNSGIYWFATYNEGICKLSLFKSNFAHYFYQQGKENSLSTKIGQSVLEDSKERIWVGTDGGGLNLFNEENAGFQHFQSQKSNPESLSSDKILYLEESYDGSIWVCTWDGGLNKFNPTTKKSKHYINDPTDSTSLGQNTVWCSAEDEFHGVWLGTQTAGLNFLRHEQNQFIRFENNSHSPNSLISNFVFSLFIDSKNRLLIGTSLGLNVIDLKKAYKNNFAKVEFLEVKNKNIQGNRINYITEDHFGNIWLGSDIGLHKLDSNLAQIVSYSTLNGLPNNLIVGIQEDNHGYLWITSKGGLTRLNPQSQKFKNFNSHDGLQGIEFQSKSIYKTKDGRIIIGGINGINIFDPEKFLTGSDTLVPEITKMRLFNKTIHVGDSIDGRVILEKSISNTTSLNLKHNQGYLSFDFVALHYQNPERVQYAYKMKNFDKEFIITGSNRTANYSNLPPGDYTFMVKASLNRDWDNAASINLPIKVLPPPWKTWWAYVIYTLIISLISWLSLKYYTKIVREEKERELDQKKLQFFINVSHEFRTPLTLILNPIEKILSAYNNADVVKDSALIIQKSARRLLNLVNQLLDFRKMDLGKTPLKTERADIVQFCKDIILLFEDLAEIKNINLKFESSSESIIMDFDPDKTEKIITNLLSNAIKFTKEKGEISLTVSKNRGLKAFSQSKTNGDIIEIKVEDTGIGIKQEHLKEVFNRFFHLDNTNTGTGIGLNFTKGLVELHGGEIYAKSEYGKGSSFLVRFPRYDEAATNNKNKAQKAATKKYEFNSNAIQSIEYEVSNSETQNDATDTPPEGFNHNNRTTVLIVEDNKELRSHLKNELGTNFKVREAVNGAQGFEMVKKHYPDIIISDVMMPEMDGFELCRRVKSAIETCHIPVILLTARSLEEDRIEGYGTGADEYLPKPFNINILKARINNLLEIKRKLREKFASMSGIVPSSEITSNSLDEAFLDKATKIVLENISNPKFSLDNLLTEASVSRSQFYRKINSITGQNPSYFIRTIRLKYASEKLKENKYSIKEIAYNCGFNSSAYFSKTFRELFGMTPQQYSEKHK